MSGKENTSLTFRLPYWSVGLILFVLIDTVSFVIDNYQVMGDTLHDYDTLTRLAYLRESLLRGSLAHGFFDRINAPYGMVFHWTLPFNLFMLGVIKFFGWFNHDTALHYAGYWGGTILRLFVGPAAYWAGRAILTPAASALASMLVLFAPYLLVYAHRGTASHHALTYLETVVMAGLAFRVVKRPLAEAFESSHAILPLALGAMAALCLWTTFEMAIIVGPLFAVLFYVWAIEGRERTAQLLLTTAAFSITVTIALLVDPPFGGLYARVIDHISSPFQVLAAVPFVIALGGWIINPKNEFRRVGYVFSATIVCLLIWLVCFLSFARHGLHGVMDPYVATEWWPQIEEVQPVNEWRKIAVFLGPIMLAMGLVFPWRAPRNKKESILMPLLLLYILGQLHFRFVFFGAVAAPYFLAYVYERSLRNNGEFPKEFANQAQSAALGMMAVFILIQISLTIIHYDIISEPSNDDVPDPVTCNPYLVKKPLTDKDWMGVGKIDPIIVNEVNHAAPLLYWTDVDTVAGNYHRDSTGIKDDYMFWRDLGDDTAKAIVKKRGVDFVLLCGNGNNVSYSFQTIAQAQKELAKPGEEFDPQETMYTRLSDEQPPPWLKLREWPDDIDTDLLLYQVDKSKLQ